MERLTNEQLAEIRKRAEATTAGPWYVSALAEGYIYAGGEFTVVASTVEYNEDGSVHTRLDNDKSVDNQEFIAHARQDVPALLAEVERLRREISFIAHVDLLKNAYNAEHIAVSVKCWALDVLEGKNHDD